MRTRIISGDQPVALIIAVFCIATFRCGLDISSTHLSASGNCTSRSKGQESFGLETGHERRHTFFLCCLLSFVSFLVCTIFGARTTAHFAPSRIGAIMKVKLGDCA
jgi:hypothetical protein